ncbi:response regulator [Desulforhabdus sp. TSK]|uniref:response regulator n=1 Tax=Desulforhabdus sp. TSK TaxID=2925014 RepID=UPI001FC7F3CC|nr:response regulator [Desulforhabdus sp. TSK]GKT08845.1 hypothetical protein DSTSK_21500 [Desulforhabdus sp. TSK]
MLIFQDAGGFGLLEAVQVKILIVEADEVFRRNISQRLRLEGHQIHEAGGENEAKLIIQRIDVDVVLLGLGKLKKRGMVLLREIKRIRPLTEVMLLTPSEEHSLSLSIEGMKAGAFDELLVPFDMETLLGRLGEAYRKRLQKKREGKPRMRVRS